MSRPNASFRERAATWLPGTSEEGSGSPSTPSSSSIRTSTAALIDSTAVALENISPRALRRHPREDGGLEKGDRGNKVPAGGRPTSPFRQDGWAATRLNRILDSSTKGQEPIHRKSYCPVLDLLEKDVSTAGSDDFKGVGSKSSLSIPAQLTNTFKAKLKGYLISPKPDLVQALETVTQSYCANVEVVIMHYLEAKSTKAADVFFRREKNQKRIITSLSHFLEDVITVFAPGATDTERADNWKSDMWIDVLHKIAVLRQRQMKPCECLAIQVLFAEYTSISEGKVSQLYIDAAEDLVDHLQTHKLDPQNILIGLHPSESILNLLRPIAFPSPSSRQPSSQKVSSSLRHASPSSLRTFTSNQDDLARCILKWECMLDNPRRLAEEIVKVASELRAHLPCLPGTLAVVDVEAFTEEDRQQYLIFGGGELSKQTSPSSPASVNPFRRLFCRVKDLTEDYVEIYLDPYQKDPARRVPHDYVLVLHPSVVDDQMASALHSWTSSQLQFLYSGVSEVIYEKIIEACEIHGVDTEVVRNITTALGKNSGSNLNPLQRSGRPVSSLGSSASNSKQSKPSFTEEEELKVLKRQMQISLRDFGKVSCAHKLLTSFLRQVQSSPVVRYCVNEGVKYANRWLSNVAPRSIYPISLELTLAQTHQFCERMPMMVVAESKQLVDVVENCMDTLNSRIEKVVNGERKDEISSWWLSYVDKRVDKFLEEREGFVLDAVPDDYTDRPPKDIGLVRSNQTILKEVLSNKDEQLKKFILDVSEEVYKVVDGFQQEIECVLHNGWVGFFGDGMEEEQRAGREEELKMELEYLVEMGEMDKEIHSGDFSPSAAKLELTKVVPISGVVMARFMMYDCEFNTVLELWDSRRKWSRISIKDKREPEEPMNPKMEKSEEADISKSVSSEYFFEDSAIDSNYQFVAHQVRKQSLGRQESMFHVKSFLSASRTDKAQLALSEELNGLLWLPLTPDEATGDDDDLGKGKWVPIGSNLSSGASSSSSSSSSSGNTSPSGISMCGSPIDAPSNYALTSPSGAVNIPSKPPRKASMVASQQERSRNSANDSPKSLASNPPIAALPGQWNESKRSVKRDKPKRSSSKSAIDSMVKKDPPESPAWTPLKTPSSRAKRESRTGLVLSVRMDEGNDGDSNDDQEPAKFGRTKSQGNMWRKVKKTGGIHEHSNPRNSLSQNSSTEGGPDKNN